MRNLLPIVSLLIFPGVRLASHFPTAGYCIGASDNVSSVLLSDVRAVVTGSDSLDGVVRTRLSLPSAAAEDVVLVTNDSTCHQAIVAVGVTDSTATAYVLRIGTTAYVVRFPPGMGGVYYYTLDSTFTIKGIATW